MFGTIRNNVHICSITYMKKRKSCGNPKSRTLEPDRPQHDHQSVCVFATAFFCHVILIPLSFPQGKIRPSLKKTVISIYFYLLFSVALQPSAGYGLFVPRGVLITHNDAPQSVGLLWTSDQLVAETSTWQHTHTTNNHTPGRIFFI